MQQQRNGQRALRVLGAGEIERVFGRVFAEIALAGGRHEAGHAVVLRLGQKLAGGRLRVHAHRQQRFEPARLLVEQADLDHAEMQQIAGEVQDVRLQQLDAVLHRHVGDLGGREIGQFQARLMDRRHLLLLVHLVGHVADVDDQVLRRLARLAHRGGMDVIVVVVAAAERGTGGLAGRQGGVEGAEVGAEDLRAAQHRVEIRPDHAAALRPFRQPPVAPDNQVVAVQQDDAVGHAFENMLVLQQPAKLQGLAEVLRRDVDAGKPFAGKMGQRSQGVAGDHHVMGFSRPSEELFRVFAGVADQEDFGLCCQSRILLRCPSRPKSRALPADPIPITL